jgi:hypothetical protein
VSALIFLFALLAMGALAVWSVLPPGIDIRRKFPFEIRAPATEGAAEVEQDRAGAPRRAQRAVRRR